MSWGIEAVRDLIDEYEDCQRCPELVECRSTVIVGSGNVRADLLIVGEAPGPGEDEEGVPFVARSGQLLMDMLQHVWPDTEEILDIRKIDEKNSDKFFKEIREYLDQYIVWTNIVCCWTGEGNRNPATTEIKACHERLHRLIYAVDPLLVVGAGKLAVSALVGKTVGIVKKRGMLFDISIDSPATGRKVRYPMLAILHPSYLLRKGDQALADKGEGDTYDTMEDLSYGLQLLDEEYDGLFDEAFPYRPRGYKE